MKFLLSFLAILFFSGMIGASYAYTTPEFIENYEERWNFFTANLDVTSDDSFSIIGNSGMNDKITVTITISSPMGNIVSIDQITPDSSGDYSTNFKVGKTWSHDGAYDISVFANQLTGENQKHDVIKVPIQIENAKIVQHDKLFDYDVDGAYVTNVQISEENNSIIISINSDSDGNLTVYLPREVIDAKIVHNENSSSSTTLLDDNFIILTDGTPTKFIELQTAVTIRSISIDFENGTSEIEIIGTQVIPEFGTITMIVLAVAIVSIITVSTKSRLRFIPQA